jgi:pimeloyl-ACP methyl ester carboxylesterase
MTQPTPARALSVRTATTGSSTIECFLNGEEDRSCVVLLPAAGCTAGYLRPLAERLAAGGLRTIAINQRGSGNSAGPVEGITLHDLAADVAAVAAQLCRGSVYVAGHAFGNRVARCVAADHPALVRGVILLAAGGRVEPDAETAAAARKLVRTDLSEDERLAAMRRVYLSPHSDPELVRRVEQPPGPTLVHAMAGKQTPVEDWWSGGRVPMLVLQGRDDRMAPPANGHALRERFGERVRVIDIERAGHLLPLEAMESVAREIANFVSVP